jgi:hypothetical protein
LASTIASVQGGVRLAGGLVVALADRLPALDDDGADERIGARPPLRHGGELDGSMEVLEIALGGGEGVH